MNEIRPRIEWHRGDCRSVEDFLAERIYEFKGDATSHDAETFALVHRDAGASPRPGISGYTWADGCSWGAAPMAAVSRSVQPAGGLFGK